MIIPHAHRTESVKEYYFSVKNKEIASLNAERAGRGESAVINLGIGSPNGIPPRPAIDKLIEVAQMPGVHAYQSYTGTPELRGAFAAWYKRYYGVILDPSCEIQPLMGSKEGILIASLTFLNPGDKVLIPDPGYPTYTSSAELVGAEIVRYDLVAEKGWLPDFEALEAMDLSGVKMMWTNYPNMPTGAKATRELYRRLVEFGRKHKILIINDNPYSFILTDEHLSILAEDGARECCLEMNSLSKAHNMAGWRIGMIAGEAPYIRELLKVKSQMDSGMFRPLQMAAVEALAAGEDWFSQLNEEYRRRRAVVQKIFDLLGATYNPDSTGLFVWGKCPSPEALDALCGPCDDPGKTPGERISDRFLYGCGVFITPGFIFGRNGRGYIRASLCANVPTLEEALSRIKKLLGK